MSETSQPDAAEPGQRQFGVQRVYVKDLSFEVPRAPDVFRAAWKPRIKMDLNTRSAKVEDGLHEVVLTLSVEARDDEDRVGFIVEVQQAGLFRAIGLSDAELHQTLGSYCPNLLFPYAREAVDNLVLRGGFPALLLAPVNFDALYAEALRQAQARKENGAAQGEPTQH
jgi:preprotein translocase subunit SecB